jgi:tRNA pseudouridine38-40 synthase
MPRYKAIIAYDGTEYNGWQAQPNQLSVANVLQNTFYSVFNKSIKIIGASRTDAGVHALGQVATFVTELELDTRTLVHAWSNRLSSNIVIRSLDEDFRYFHPQKNVVQKTYWYHFFLHRPLPFAERYGYFFRHPVNLEKLVKGLETFVGTHDFRSFCTGDEHHSTIRTIDSIAVHHLKRWGAYRIEVKGPGFLHFMIRRIVGACLEVSSRNFLSTDYLQEVLDQKSPQQTLPNAPAKGLLLYKIQYAKKGECYDNLSPSL